MKFLKRFLNGTSVALLGFFISTLLTILAVVTPLTNEQYVTSTVRESGVYGNITQVFIDQLQNPSNNEQSLAVQLADNPLDPEDIYDVARDIFTSNYWQNTLEPVITSGYKFARSDSETLEFSINVAQSSGEFADSLEARVVDIFSALPECTLAEEANYNFANAQCVPASLSVREIAEKQVEQFRSNDSPFATAKISSEDLNIAPETLGNIQDWYQLVTVLPILLGGTIVLLSIIVILTARSKISGARRIGHLFVIGGLFGAAGYFMLGAFAKAINLSDGAQNSAEISVVENLIAPIAKLFIENAANRGIFVSLVCAAIGFAVWLIALLVHRRYHLDDNQHTITAQEVGQHPQY